jgi:hypothetical protein
VKRGFAPHQNAGLVSAGPVARSVIVISQSSRPAGARVSDQADRASRRFERDNFSWRDLWHNRARGTSARD